MVINAYVTSLHIYCILFVVVLECILSVCIKMFIVGIVTQVVEYLPRRYEVLSSNPSTTKNKY
jgi:hypothetical protein